MPSSVSFFSPRSSSPAFHIVLNTPACTHCWNLSCTVVPAPKLRGSALHWHPVRSTYRMAVIAFRSSIGGRPPLVRFLCRGSSGITRAHTASGRQYFASIPIVWVESRDGAVPTKCKPVSISRSSNWTCGFAASSSRAGFASGIRAFGYQKCGQTDKPVAAV